MSILEGLEELGLSKLEELELYGSEEPEHNTEEGRTGEKPIETEESLLFPKEFTCPVCGENFKQLIVKTGKARVLGQDQDLRPKHKCIDVQKYDVILCNSCGYAALKQYYKPLPGPYRDMIREKIASNYRRMEPFGETITYPQAIKLYRLALVNAIVRQGKDSEKALICLKNAWLLRGMQEVHDTLSDEEAIEYPLEWLIDREEQFLSEAKEGFIKARQHEEPPYAGMNEVTLDYLLAVLCFHFGEYDNAAKLLVTIIQSKQAGKAQKDKARALVSELREKVKNQ